MSQLYIRPFMVKGNTVNLAVTNASARVAVTRPGVGIQSIRLTNIGTQNIFITIGTSTVTSAVATGFPMLPNTVETFMLDKESTHIAAIADASGSTLYVTTGESA
jgi:hypothetical protein